MKPILALAGAYACILSGSIGLALSSPACTPAESAQWSKIEATVRVDVENGSALAVIETAVAALDPAAATVAGLVDQIIVEAIQLLEDTGALPVLDGSVSNADAVKAQAMGKVVAAKADSR